jgi:hypothetical protein
LVSHFSLHDALPIFYNAGEGSSYQREQGARLNARDEYDRAYAEVEAAGLLGEFDRNQYLV